MLCKYKESLYRKIKKLLFSGIDSKKKLKGIYHIYNDLNVITPTKKKPVIR